MKKILFIIIILLTLLFLYGRYIEPNNIIIKEYTINTEKIPESFKELKIVHFSDLLYDHDVSRLDIIKEKINNENPDIILFTGNLFDNNNSYDDDDYNNLKSFLTGLEADYYKYTIFGNNDEKYLEKFKDILYESNFILLNNDSSLFFYKDKTPINIIGITDLNTDIDSLFKSDIEYNYNLILTDKPDNIEALKNYDVDTFISGHSLGGIINIPYYGGIIKMEGSQKYINEYYKIDDIELFVNNGLGYKYFNYRLFNTPSINVYIFDN